MSVILKNVCKIHLKENVWNVNSYLGLLLNEDEEVGFCNTFVVHQKCARP